MDRQRERDGPQGKKTQRYTKEAGVYRVRSAKASARGCDGVSTERAGEKRKKQSLVIRLKSRR